MPTYFRPYPDGIFSTEKVIVNVELTPAVIDVGLTVKFGSGRSAKVGVIKLEMMMDISKVVKIEGYNLAIVITQENDDLHIKECALKKRVERLDPD